MLLSAPPRYFDPNDLELVDRPDVDSVQLRAEMETLEKANRWLGAHQLMIESVSQMLSCRPPAALRVLDLGTGLADIPRVLVTWARRNGQAITITAMDGNPPRLDGNKFCVTGFGMNWNSLLLMAGTNQFTMSIGCTSGPAF